MTQDHNTATHTQGLWSFDGQRVKDPNGKTVADMRYMSGRVNGAVVAAAPDMLDAHKENARILGYLCDELQGIVEAGKLAALNSCLDRSLTAIAKAEGRE